MTTDKSSKSALDAIAALHEQFEGWTIDSIEPSDKGDVGIKFNLSFGLNNHASVEVGYSSYEGSFFIDGKEIQGLQ
ncbi:MAG: hypothetical protein PHN78_02200 [Dehalococcoidales bacterium]|jgi:hypothetical protein|nr:hypothetical protein [Dehalococcoidales bacterium]